MARNKDVFEKPLAKMLIEKREKSIKDFDSEIRKIAGIVKDSILKKGYLEEGCNLKKKISPELKTCEEYAKTCDAIDYLRDYIFVNKTCRSLKEDMKDNIRTMECEWNHNYKKFRDNIVEKFKENISTEIYKGFVYIFWTVHPPKYWYVGETTGGTKYTGVERLRNDRHCNVVQSSKDATKLTIIYPSHPSHIKKIEASIIRVIGIKEKGGELEYNDQQEPFHEGISHLSKRLKELKNFLGY